MADENSIEIEIIVDESSIDKSINNITDEARRSAEQMGLAFSGELRLAFQSAQSEVFILASQIRTSLNAAAATGFAGFSQAARLAASSAQVTITNALIESFRSLNNISFLDGFQDQLLKLSNILRASFIGFVPENTFRQLKDVVGRVNVELDKTNDVLLLANKRALQLKSTFQSTLDIFRQGAAGAVAGPIAQLAASQTGAVNVGLSDNIKKRVQSSFEFIKKQAKSAGSFIKENISRDIERAFDFSNAKRNIVSFARSASTIRGLTGAFKGLFSAVFNLRNLIIGAVAGAGITALFSKVTQLASEQEDAVNQLNNSLRTAGSFSQEASQSFQNLASELQNNSRFGDEVILQQLALARNFTRTNEEAEKLTRAAIDLSEATSLTLESAVLNLGRTLSGLTGELGEQVSQVRGLTAEQLKAGAAIDVISRRFGGSALAATRTYSGAVAQLSNNFSDFLETIGQQFTQSPEVIAFVNQLSGIFNNLSGQLKDGGQQFNNFFISVLRSAITFVQTFISIFQRLNNFIDETIATLKNFRLTFLEIKRDLQSIAGDSGVLQGLFFGASGAQTAEQAVQDLARTKIQVRDLKSELSELAQQNTESNAFFDNLLAKLDDLFLNTIIGAENIRRNGPAKALKDNFQENSLDPEIAKLLGSIGQLRGEAITILQQAFAPDTLDGQESIFESLEKKSKEQLQKIQNNVKQFVETNKAQIQQFNDAIENGFARAVSAGIQSFVNALVEGTNALEAFGKAFLGVLGDVAIQLGTTILVGGLGLKSLFSGNPAGAVVFGGALIAVGTLLKALSGGGFEGAGFTGGAPPGDQSVVSDLLPGDDFENQARVQVNIEGQILSDDDTVGLRIAEILKDQGFNNAVVS